MFAARVGWWELVTTAATFMPRSGGEKCPCRHCPFKTVATELYIHTLFIP